MRSRERNPHKAGTRNKENEASVTEVSMVYSDTYNVTG